MLDDQGLGETPIIIAHADDTEKPLVLVVERSEIRDGLP
jgi:hypothetical protein